MEFAINQPVYIVNLKKKGVVKEVDTANSKSKVTFYNKDDRRITAWMDNSELQHYVIKKAQDLTKQTAKSGERIGHMLKEPWDKLTTLHGGEVILSKNDSKMVLRAIEAIKADLAKGLKVEIEFPQKKKTDFEKVREFQIAFDCPAPESPVALDDKLAMNRANFILEEVIELLYASCDKSLEKFDILFKNLLSATEKSYHKQIAKPFPEERLIGQVDALIDVSYFATGGLVEMSVVPEKIFDIVHSANMAKIFPDGKPHYNEVGKVIKPDGWEEPEPKIKEELKRQSELGARRFS